MVLPSPLPYIGQHLWGFMVQVAGCRGPRVRSCNEKMADEFWGSQDVCYTVPPSLVWVAQTDCNPKEEFCHGQQHGVLLCAPVCLLPKAFAYCFAKIATLRGRQCGCRWRCLVLNTSPARCCPELHFASSQIPELGSAKPPGEAVGIQWWDSCQPMQGRPPAHP